MKMIIAALAAASLCAVSAPASAKVTLEANGGRSEGTWGGELGIGYSILSLGGFSITPSVGAFIYRGNNDRYYMDNNGGNPRCRDSTNGQYASTMLCDNTAAKAYGRIEATYSPPTAFTFGVGARYMSDHVRPYGTVAFPLAPKIIIKANAGPKYYAAGLSARF